MLLGDSTAVRYPDIHVFARQQRKRPLPSPAKEPSCAELLSSPGPYTWIFVAARWQMSAQSRSSAMCDWHRLACEEAKGLQDVPSF